MTALPRIVLSIESAIAGGSISLIVDGREVANWIGSAGVSKAEELLVNIDHLLSTNGLTARDLDLIAVSAGPGSFTGIRIGIATALGLKAGLGIEISSESALIALASQHSAVTGTLLVAVPLGRNAVCIQSFNGGKPIDEPRTVSEDAFDQLVSDKGDTTIAVHSAITPLASDATEVVDLGNNIAYPLGLICRENVGVVTEPLFIAKGF
jgi:tRNA threonylcarbamoyladenosine biosynthesis protein TsaB